MGSVGSRPLTSLCTGLPCNRTLLTQHTGSKVKEEEVQGNPGVSKHTPHPLLSPWPLNADDFSSCWCDSQKNPLCVHISIQDVKHLKIRVRCSDKSMKYYKSKKEIMRSRKHMKQHSPVLTYSDCCCFKHVRQLQQQVLVYDFLLCIYWNPQLSADSFSMFLFSCQLRHLTFQQDNTDRSNNFPHSSPQTIFWSSTGTEGNLHISICWTINI